MQSLLEPLRAIADPQERLAAIIARRGQVAELEEADRVEQFRVSGCVSRVWLRAGRSPEDRLRLEVAAEAVMVRGLVVLLCDLYDGLPMAELPREPVGLADRLGLENWVTPTRLAGLAAFESQIRREAGALRTMPGK